MTHDPPRLPILSHVRTARVPPHNFVWNTDRLLLMPALDAVSPGVWGAFPPSAQLFVACGFAAAGTTFVLLPRARAFSERVGFMGAQSSSTPAALCGSFAALLLAYAALLGAGSAASAVAERNWHVERLGKQTPHRPSRRPSQVE